VAKAVTEVMLEGHKKVWCLTAFGEHGTKPLKQVEFLMPELFFLVCVVLGFELGTYT
jgi:hypothetical protein